MLDDRKTVREEGSQPRIIAIAYKEKGFVQLLLDAPCHLCKNFAAFHGSFHEPSFDSTQGICALEGQLR